MLNRILGVLAVAGMCALSFVLLNCGSSSSRPAGLLYVISEAENNISSFSLDLDNGGLSLVNSNATTCSTLTGSNPQSCGLAVSMLLDPTGATAFILNQGVACVPGQNCNDPCGPPNAQCASIVPTIYGYTVNSDGSLSAPATPVVWTHPLSSTDTHDDADTALAMVRDSAGAFLFVINKGSTPSQSNNFLADCPQAPTGNFDACPSISVFSTSPGSTGATLTGNECAGTSTPCSFWLDRIPTALSVLTFTPPNGGATQTLLFVTSNKDLTSFHNDNELSVYSVDASGNLTETANSPYTTAPNPGVVLGVNTNSPPQTTGGVFVYVGAQGSASGSVSAFQICTVVGSQGNGVTCTQQQVQSEELIAVGTPSAAGKNPLAMLVDPTNNFLYVASNGSSQVFAFQVATGTGLLSPLSPASGPTGAQPVALAMQTNFNATSNFIYTSNQGGESITGFTVSTTTGALNPNPTTTLFSPGLPSAMAAK